MEGGASSSTIEVVGWTLSFSAASTSMMLLNKLAVTDFGFPYTLVLLQTMMTLVMALIVAKIFAPSGDGRFALSQQLTLGIVRKWMPAVILFVFMLVSSMASLQKTSVPTVLVFRSLMPLLTAIFETAFLGTPVNLRVWLSLIIILLGTLCYLATDLKHLLSLAYLWNSINVLAAVLYFVYVKWIINTIKPSVMDMVLWNNLLSLPVLVLIVVFFDKVSNLPAGFAHMEPVSWVWVFCSMLASGWIAFAGFGLQAAVSATTATVINHVTKLLSFVGSIIIFKDTFSVPMVLGLLITFVGTVGYGFERVGAVPSSAEKKADKDVESEPAASKPPRAPNEKTTLLDSERTTTSGV